MQKTDHKKGPRNSRGESMVLAVVIMLVFFTLGASVLTAASVANASVGARLNYRQAYYYARSTFDVLDTSLQNGALGERIRQTELDRLIAAHTDGSQESIELTGVTLALPLSFDDNGPENLTFTDGGALFTYDVTANFVAGSQQTRAFLSIQNAALTLHTVCGGKSYGLRVVYQYAGWANLIDGVWSFSGQWKLRSIA